MPGGGSNAGSRAAEAQASANREAIAEQRRQFEQTQQLLDPFVQAGVGQAGALQEGATAEGLDARLSRIFGSEAFSSLREERERSVRGQLSAGGFTRSGTALQEIANVPTQLGFGIEEALTGRSQQLFAGSQNAAIGVGQFGAGASGNISTLLQDTGRARASGIISDAEAAAQRRSGLGGTLGTIAGAGLGFALGGPSGTALSLSSTGLGASLGGSFGGAFSDPKLKKNAEVVGRIVDLDIYEWDWIDLIKNTEIANYPNTGFMADEVQKKYPHLVEECCGFLMINLPVLLDELEAKI